MFKMLLILSFPLAAFSEVTPERGHASHIFVDKCLHELPERPSMYVPYAVLSICHLKKDHLQSKCKEPVSKPVCHFSPHSYFIRIANIDSIEDAVHFEVFYEKLFIPAKQMQLFEFIGTKYREFPQYNPAEAKKELIRERWNRDEILALNSPGALNLMRYNENQLPTSIQREDPKYKMNNVSDLELTYYITSGYGQNCVHNSWYEKLASLTYDFTAYDRIFCDAFEYHGLQKSFKGYWNLADMYYFRGKLVRDGLVSSFPPDANAVFYASPKLTFMILERNPITWLFVSRPFKKSLWMFLFISFVSLEVIRNLKSAIDHIYEYRLKRSIIQRNLFAVIVTRDETKLEIIGQRFANMLAIFNGVLRIILASVYSGMILVGILHPLYPWTPETFKDLNSTTNYVVGTAEFSPFFIMDNLIDQFKLNRLPPEMRQNRVLQTPALYLDYSNTDSFVMENPNTFYASVMYDDKMNLWMKGRFIISQTASFLERLKPAKDHVLPEIRYVSVAPGATRLHFLMITLKRVFTSGTWLRWYYLEQNYYTNIAPIIAAKKMEKKEEISKDRRPLNIHDLFSVFAIEGGGLLLAFLLCVFELYTTCSYTQQL